MINTLFGLLLFNGVLAYAYAHIRSTYYDRFPFLAAYLITGKYLLLYVIIAMIF